MTDQPAVLTERRDNVLVITLNRPEVRNAVNGALAEGVAAALDELDGDDSLTLGVLTGAGGFFCAGMDLGAFVKGESPYVDDRGFAGITQRASAKPLIAAIEGFAVAGGLEVALSCDLVVAASGAKLGIPESKRSLVAAAGALLRLPRRMPVPRRHGAGAHRRPDAGGALPRARARQPDRRARVGPRRRARARGGDQPQRPARPDRLEAGPGGAVRLVERGDVGAPGRDRRPGDDLRGRPRGRQRVQGESESRSGGGAEPSAVGAAGSAEHDREPVDRLRPPRPADRVSATDRESPPATSSRSR